MNGESHWGRLESLVLDQFLLSEQSYHGPAHWSRVAHYGRALARLTGADEEVVRLFALFHDAGRVAEEDDPGHGTRGAALAVALAKKGEMTISSRQLVLLLEACDGHTEMLKHEDPTIATCFDADRLDLARYGMEVDPKFLNTAAAKEWVQQGNQWIA